ncbi:hypothetical protein JW766_00980 [Candidatus Dojkabacteria bacterium]|nr:hypothetical protein [Candidatus Dojkabacteria bacterium]
MSSIDWNNISQKKKDIYKKYTNGVFVAGSMFTTNKKVQEILFENIKSRILFGCLKDKEIPGLEGSPQFSPMKKDVLKKFLKNNRNVQILKHFHKDTKNIIKEFKPHKVVFINGSWQGPIHYRSEYWKAIEVGAKIELISPFASEREAKNYEKRIADSQQLTADSLYKKRGKYSDKELMKLASEVSKFSWDWIGQTGAVLAKKGKVLAVAWNRVVPYEAYQMFEGSPREENQIPSQEMLETQLTNHAECEILEIARREKINLKGTSLYINLFPCPICAKMLSRSEIGKIVYSQDHNLGNDIGYRILEMSSKNIRRVII